MPDNKSPYWNLFADIYGFLRDHLPGIRDPEYWETVTADSVRLAEKYQGKRLEPFCNALLSAILQELSRE